MKVSAYSFQHTIWHPNLYQHAYQWMYFADPRVYLLIFLQQLLFLRLLIGEAEPFARGRKRFGGPSFAEYFRYQVAFKQEVVSALLLSSALWDDSCLLFGVNVKIALASATLLLLDVVKTRRDLKMKHCTSHCFGLVISANFMFSLIFYVSSCRLPRDFVKYELVQIHQPRPTMSWMYTGTCLRPS